MLHHYKFQKTIVAEQISPANFELFGGVISSSHQLETAQSSSANYGTATKLLRVSPVTNKHLEAEANLNLFRCSPPGHLIDDHSSEDGGQTYTSKVLERHPHSTQTFIPMGRPSTEISYMVIVALPDPADPQRLPQVDDIRAFVVKGDQAVTYGVGIWHAPMIALGSTTDFAVLIHETGDPSLDTEEVSLDKLWVEFTTLAVGESQSERAAAKRKPQSNEEFEVERNNYNGPPNPSEENEVSVGDPRFDAKQVKYAVERAYYAKQYSKVVELVSNLSPEISKSKLGTELNEISRRAQERIES